MSATPRQLGLKRWLCMITAALCLFSAPTVFAQVEVNTLDTAPILAHGRVKPLETYAQHVLLQFSGRKSFDRKPALDWLLKLVFAPETTSDDLIFLINHPDIPRAMGVPPSKKRRYSFEQLKEGVLKLSETTQAALALEAKDRSAFEAESIRVHDNLMLYSQLLDVFSFAKPHPDFSVDDTALRKQLDLREAQRDLSFIDIALRAPKLRESTDALLNKTPEDWSVQEQEAFRLMGTLYLWAQRHTNLPFQILPPIKATEEVWLSPWDAVSKTFYSETIRKELFALAKMKVAYLNGEQTTFNEAALTLRTSTQNRSRHLWATKTLGLEKLYNTLNPFVWSQWFYLLIAITCFMRLLKDKPAPHWTRHLMWILFALHTAGLVLRITILARPPVTNLYETFIFVAWVSVLLSFWLERIHQRGAGRFIGALGGFLLLTIASKFAAEGDTLKMLVAVLNSNFWLSTHVITITIGYAGCCVAGLMGHLYLIQACRKIPQVQLDKTYRMMWFVLGFGLLFSALGTALGGIWADQSWGRFWGWDPKENGALMIVLWCAILFHARISGWIQQIGAAAGCVIGAMVVMWAWFGVNLLSVGLHSYGFTSGIALNLLLYMIFEVAFLLVAVPLAKR